MLPSAASISINLKFSKECNEKRRVSRNTDKNTFKTVVSERVQKPKPSLKVSLPIKHYLKVMQQNKNSNAWMKTLNPNHTDVPRLPQQSDPQPTIPCLPLSHSSLRTFRHPVPTSRARMTLAGRFEMIIRKPEPISIKTTSKGNPNMPDSNITNPLIKEPVKIKVVELKTSEYKPNTPVEMLYRSTDDNSFATSIKHKLPLTVATPKRGYGNKSSNPINKENRRCTPTHNPTQNTTHNPTHNITHNHTHNTIHNPTHNPIYNITHNHTHNPTHNPPHNTTINSTHNPTTAVQATQTENVFFVTEEGYQIIETIQTSGLTATDVQNLIENIKKQTTNNTDNVCEVIDLESTDEDSTNKDILDIVMKHSSNNKNVLKSAAQILQLLSVENHQSSTTTAPPFERITPNSDHQLLLGGTVSPATFEPSPSGRPIPYGEMVNSFMVLATLQQHGFRFTNIAVESPLTQVQRTDLQTTHTFTQTDAENNNSNKRKRHATYENSSELGNMVEQNYFQRPPMVAVQSGQEFMAMPQQQELSVFPPHMQRQLSQTQIQQFVHSPQFPSNLPSFMPQQRNRFTMPTNRLQYPFEHNRTSALSTPRFQLQMPTPVQQSSAVQMHPNDPRSQGMQSQLGELRGVSRVYSTQEANQRTQAGQPQHPDGNRSFPQYFNHYGNVFP